MAPRGFLYLPLRSLSGVYELPAGGIRRQLFVDERKGTGRASSLKIVDNQSASAGVAQAEDGPNRYLESSRFPLAQALAVIISPSPSAPALHAGGWLNLLRID